MQVSKWGNSLAIRLPAAVVEALDLKDGDQIEVRIAGEDVYKRQGSPYAGYSSGFTNTVSDPASAKWGFF